MLSFSYSDFSSLVQCYQKYKLIKIDGLKIPQTGDMAFGSALHAGIHAALENDNAESVFDLYWNSEKDKGLGFGRHNWEQLKDMGEKFMARFQRMHARKFVPQRMEERLYAEYKGIKFEGTPDFIGAYEGQLTVFDWKTSAYRYDKDKPEVALQLYLYAYLAMQNIKDFKPEVLGYLVFCKGTESIQTLTWPFDENRMHELLESMHTYCSKVDLKKDFPKNPNACIMGSMKCHFFKQCWGKK